MTYTELVFTYDDCTVRVRKPDLTKEDTDRRQKNLMKATEKFLKKVIEEKEGGLVDKTLRTSKTSSK